MPKIENNIIKIVLSSGAFGIALVSLGMFYKLATNGLEHSTAALMKLEATMSQFAEVERQQTEVLKDLKTLIQNQFR